jgi:hypothetical protein
MLLRLQKKSTSAYSVFQLGKESVSSHHHHWTMSIPENLFSGRPDEHLLESRLATSPKYDQVDVVRFRTMDDLLNGVTHGNIGLQFNAQVFRTLNDFLELLFKMFARVIEHGIELNHRRGFRRTSDGEKEHFRVQRLSQGEGTLRRLV